MELFIFHSMAIFPIQSRILLRLSHHQWASLYPRLLSNNLLSCFNHNWFLHFFWLSEHGML